MGVIGKPKGFLSEETLRHMLIGESGYIEAEDIIVTNKGLFVSVWAEIFDSDEKDSFDVLVRRIGPGLTQNDFEIDFTDCEYEFLIESGAKHHHYLKNEGEYVLFENVEIEHVSFSDKKNIEKSIPVDGDTIDKLQKELDEAIEEQDFEKATKIRNEMEKRGWKPK